tara:strand:+ start:107 stop:814 length:708 start_codon:yes stop_codon:yes gene_type:complete
MNYDLKFSLYNERSILIEWPSFIDENILKSILSYKKQLQKIYVKQKVEIINTYNSILIFYNFTIDNFNNEVLKLKSLKNRHLRNEIAKAKLWEIPVCYDDEFGIDLNEFSMRKKLTKSEIIKLHSEAVYTVYFIGFSPGFLYLGGLNSKLHFNRKSTPNLNIKKGSVAIGGMQTGIYPQNSPGGWHIIGKTPIDLFDAKMNPPCFISAGDKVRFKPIDMIEYSELEQKVQSDFFS